MHTPAAKDRQGSVAGALPEGKYGDIVRYGTSRGLLRVSFATLAIGQRRRRACAMSDLRVSQDVAHNLLFIAYRLRELLAYRRSGQPEIVWVTPLSHKLAQPCNTEEFLKVPVQIDELQLTLSSFRRNVQTDNRT
jgi:hypothetical protein